MMLLEVAVAAPIHKSLTYSLADNLSPDRSGGERLVGRRVIVPLGRRKVTGYVLGTVKEVEAGVNVRGIVEIPDSEPIFHPEIIELFRWVARYYHYPIGEVIKTAIPSGLTRNSATVLVLPGGMEKKFSDHMDKTTSEWGRNLLAKGSITPAETKKILADKNIQPLIQKLLKNGILHKEEILTKDSVREKNEICYSLNTDLPSGFVECGIPNSKNYKKLLDGLPFLKDHSLKLSEVKTLYYVNYFSGVQGGGDVPRKELTSAYSGSSASLTTLVDNGLVCEKKKRVFRSPLGEQLPYFQMPERLTDGQQQVLTEIYSALESEKYTPFLLHGVTGSGKTEVYLRATEAALKNGRDILVIVPEIAIATQLEAHFVSRFKEQVVLLHSGLSNAQKFDQYQLALNQKAKIVIGARSAIFAPLKDIGLIVVDEEHDGSLKQDDKLRYNGRDLALVRARQTDAVVILGSATPSVVSYHNCVIGKYKLLQLPDRVGDRELPHVSVIDLTKGTSQEKRKLFREPLERGLKENLRNGCQSVILLNRRGFAASVICKECGQPVQCRNCNVSLTRHQSKQQLICHYCGFGVHEKTVCSSCGSTSLVSIGIGTERVEEELTKLFPEARIARLDTDTAADRNNFLKVIREMRQGDIDILVGTQMIAKGLHFPGVTLVGVVWADGGLCMPDYRAAERTYQLLTQVTGRAGRGDLPGRVFIQTMRPDHYALKFAREHRYEDFVNKELELRRAPLYPPFVRLVTIHIRGEAEAEVNRCSTQLATMIRRSISENNQKVELLGPGPAPIDRIKNRFRWQLLLKSQHLEHLHRVCDFVQTCSREVCGGRCQVVLDIDPENMM